MIGDYLRRARLQRGYTLGYLSMETGLSISYLSDLEHKRSEPSLKTLVAIGKVYDMGAGDLLIEAGYSKRVDRKAERHSQAQHLAACALGRAIDALWEEENSV